MMGKGGGVATPRKYKYNEKFGKIVLIKLPELNRRHCSLYWMKVYNRGKLQRSLSLVRGVNMLFISQRRCTEAIQGIASFFCSLSVRAVISYH